MKEGTWIEGEGGGGGIEDMCVGRGGRDWEEHVEGGMRLVACGGGESGGTHAGSGAARETHARLRWVGGEGTAHVRLG